MVAPGAALRRARAMAALDVTTRYAGATTGRRGGSWRDANASANVSIGGKLSLLRARSHEMVRDNWAFARILDVLVAHSVGHGIQILPDNGSDRIDRQVRERFDEWSETAEITDEGDLHFAIGLAVRSMFEGGSSLIRFVPRPRRGDDTSVNFGLQVLEGEHIDHSRDGAVDGRHVRLGVALGDHDRRLGYYLHPAHPGDAWAAAHSGSRGVSVFTPRSEVLHLYRALRPGQLLGVPIFAPVLLTARDHQDLMDAVIVKAKIEACFAGFIRRPDGLDPLGAQTATDARTGQEITSLEPGMLVRLQMGEDITFASPPSGGSFAEVNQATLYAMAAGAGVTYDQLTGDLRQANYSSLRAGKIEFRRLIEQIQWLTIIPQVHRRIAHEWTRRAIAEGVLRRRSQGYRWQFIVPANEPIDPKKDLEADIMAVRAGRMSPQEFVAGWGRDWRDVVDNWATYLAEIDRAGLVLDIDPRRTSQSGTRQGGDDGAGGEGADDDGGEGGAPPPNGDGAG